MMLQIRSKQRTAGVMLQIREETKDCRCDAANQGGNKELQV